MRMEGLRPMAPKKQTGRERFTSRGGDLDLAVHDFQAWSASDLG